MLGKDYVRAQSLDNELSNLVVRLRLDEILELAEDFTGLCETAEILKLRDKVRLFGMMVSQPQPGPSCTSCHLPRILVAPILELRWTDVTQLKETTELVQDDLIRLRRDTQEARLKLDRTERELNQQVEALKEKMEKENYTSGNPETFQLQSSSVQKTSSSDANQALPSEVEEYHHFLAHNGGHLGFWDDRNHSNFLKYREKYGAKNPKFIEACVRNLIGVNTSVVEAHEEWYREYIRTRNAYKGAIESWKRQKKKAVAQVVEEIVDRKGEQETKVKQLSVQEKIKRQKVKQALEEWKAQKEVKKEVKPQADPNLDKKLAKEAEEAEERRKTKRRVQAYVERKGQLQALEKELLELSSNIRKKEANLVYGIERKRFEEKNQEFLQRRTESMQRKLQEGLKKQKRVEKILSEVNVHVERDPSRLLQPTKGLLNKIASESDPAERARKSFEATVCPKRHIPSWRQDL